MIWESDTGRDVTSALIGVTTPVRELLDEIHKRGWTTDDVDIKDGTYLAVAKNPHGETLETGGKTEATAVGNLLMKIIRREHIRSAAWKTDFIDQLPDIAQAYAEAPMYDPKAHIAWQELAQDSTNRAKVLKTQLVVEYVDDPAPYLTADEMREDVAKKKHIFVTRANANHPVWSVQQMLDFRLVHDVLGHCVAGGDWGWHGENMATAAHMPLLSEMAQKALFTEALGQTAYGTFYQQWGPQKIAFLDELLAEVQEKENRPGHSPVHPSQSVAPTELPSIEDELPKVSSVQGDLDPNHDWQSGVDPLPDNAYLWQRDPTTGVDPLDAQGVMENARQLDSRLALAHPAQVKQAVANAFRGVLLQPRKNLMNAAIHYQDLAHIPADVDDPLVFHEALETNRDNWNQARGYAPGSHIGYWPELQQFKQWVKTNNPHLDDGQVDIQARRELMHMLAEEEERLTNDDTDTQTLTAEEVERLAHENMAKRLKMLTKPSVDDKHDFGVTRLFHSHDHAGNYGSYLVSSLKPIARVGRHADELTKAAIEDLRAYKGAGHHFRSTALGLGIPGIGPKQISQAWLHLAPMTSQLAVLDPHVVEALGEKWPISNRDYFKHERQLQAGRDAAGYSSLPLGAFSWGIWDHKNGGPGFHQDYSAFRPIHPVSHQHVDWTRRQPPLQDSMPDTYWWDSTQPARDDAGKFWDRSMGVNFNANDIPFRTAAAETPQQFRPWFVHPETGEEHEGEPGMSLMQHLKNTLGQSGVQAIWANEYQVGKR